MDRQRRIVLGGLLAGLALVGLVLLRAVLGTVFLAITVAYVLYPLRRWLSNRGVGPRVAATVSTLVAFLAAIAIVTPLAAALYFRRADFFAFLAELPPELTIEFAGVAYTINLSGLFAQTQALASSVAADMARAMPTLALELFLFALLVYGLLLYPERVRAALLRPVPAAYHDVALALHRRARETLYGLYLLQAATAGTTFAVAWAFFFLLGYPTAFVLAALSGLLQFIPVVGPSLLVLTLAALAVVNGNITLAVIVTVGGLVVIGFLPDAVIRPRMASLTTGLPATLYFIGFVGGVLSIGVVGIIAGPLIVALVAETLDLLSPRRSSVQQRLED